MKLAKLNENTLELAPSKLHSHKNGKEIFVTNPSIETLKAEGYKELIEAEEPEYDYETQRVEISYEEVGDRIFERKTVVEIEEAIE